MQDKEYGFRDFDDAFFYIPDNSVFRNMIQKTDIVNPQDLSGYITYSYIDPKNGLSMQILASAGVDDNNEMYEIMDFMSVLLIIRMEAFEEISFVPLNYDEIYPVYKEEVDTFRKMCYRGEELKELRACKELDSLRHPYFPDDIQVHIFKAGAIAEIVWVSPIALASDRIVGILLNEPSEDFGVHQGDMIDFRLVDDDDGLKAFSSLGFLDEW